jgi:hypothetical protein
VSFLLAEDEALHTLLKGVTVSDERNPSRPVGVWFGMPDPEIREQKYPFLTIDLVGISPENDRALSGPYVKRSLDRPDGVPIPSATQEVVGELPPTPYTLEYQITTWARIPRHDRQILADLLGNALSHKFGDLPVHSDNSIRRLDIVGLNKRDIVDNNQRRLFRNVFTARVSSELFAWQVSLVERARNVVLTIDTL